jgi:hypothetical protein
MTNTDREAPRNFDGDRIVTIQVADAYVRRYPHLSYLQANLSRDRFAHKDFARVALRLEAPFGVSILDVWHMSAVAEGIA